MLRNITDPDMRSGCCIKEYWMTESTRNAYEGFCVSGLPFSLRCRGSARCPYNSHRTDAGGTRPLTTAARQRRSVVSDAMHKRDPRILESVQACNGKKDVMYADDDRRWKSTNGDLFKFGVAS